MTEKAINVLNLIKQYNIFFDFTANDISQVASEKIYPATLTSMVKEGILKKVGNNPSLYRINKDIIKSNNNEVSNYIWEPLELMEDGSIGQSKDFDIPIEITKGRMKFKTTQNIVVGQKIDFFDERIDNDCERYMLWNIMNYREDLKFIIFTFNKKYDKMLPDNWKNGYKNVTIKILED